MGVLVEDMASFIRSSGLLPAGWKMYLRMMPADPDQVVVVSDYSGNVPMKKVSLEEPGLQIRTRGVREDSASPAAILDAIRLALDAPSAWPSTINGTNYRYVNSVQSAPMCLGYDGQDDRWEFSCNFIVGRGR